MWLCFRGVGGCVSFFFQLHRTIKLLLILMLGFVVFTTCVCVILSSFFFFISAGPFDLFGLSGFCILRTFCCVH